MCNYERFQSAFMFWDASPRMIKAIILHPRLVIALHQKHVRSSKAYDPEVSEGELKLMLEDWNIPKDMVYTVDSNTLNSAVKSFEAGLTPMRAIQEHYAEVDDGEEVSFDDAIAIYGSSGTLLLVPLMAIAFALAFVVAILAAYNNGVAI